MIDKLMKKILFVIATIAAISSSCSQGDIDNMTDGGYIFSGTDFTLSPLDSSVEFYVRSQIELEYEWIKKSDDSFAISSVENHGLTTYTISVGPNITDGEREFVLSFYHTTNGEAIVAQNVTIKQANAILEADDDNIPLIWNFNELVEKQINYNANFEFKCEIISDEMSSDKFTYSANGSTLLIIPKDKNHSEEVYNATFKVAPKTDNVAPKTDNDAFKEFKEKYTREYQLIQNNLIFEVDKNDLKFYANNPKLIDVKVTYNGDWTPSCKDVELLKVNKMNNETIRVELNLDKGDFSETKETTIEVKADCDKTIEIKVTIFAKDVQEEE